MYDTIQYNTVQYCPDALNGNTEGPFIHHREWDYSPGDRYEVLLPVLSEARTLSVG